MSKKIIYCRVCNSSVFSELLSLGSQSFTGIFPEDKKIEVPVGQLDLIKCEKCDLVQLGHSFDLNLLYGKDYGYRSGLNASMVRHLNDKVKKLIRIVELKEGDLVIDIGSNDGTTLRAYPDRNLEFIGIDPTGDKFKKFYPSDVRLISNFFSADLVLEQCRQKKAKIVTSFSMFYDLEEPVKFMRDIESILHEEGIWVFEQSYLRSMLDNNSYDTICHEHLEYYGVKQIYNMAEEVGLVLLSVEFNEVNGGSFSVVAAKKESKFNKNSREIEEIIDKEEKIGLYSAKTFKDFSRRIRDHKSIVKKFFEWAHIERKLVIGYGASTKGNVLLQYCGLTVSDIPCIAEVNEDKFGAFTPATLIPIVSEVEARRMKPDYYFVLPWHFRAGILTREIGYQNIGGKFIFPLPDFRIDPFDKKTENLLKSFS